MGETVAMLTLPPLKVSPWWEVWGKVGATCLRPVESNAGVGNHNRATQKGPEGDDKHMICSLYDDD